MMWLTKAWAWLRRWWKAVIGALGGVIVVGLGSAIAIGVYKRKAVGLRDTIDVERTRTRIATLRGRREEILKRSTIVDGELVQLEEELEVNRKKIVEARRRANVSTKDIIIELAELGY